MLYSPVKEKKTKSPRYIQKTLTTELYAIRPPAAHSIHLFFAFKKKINKMVDGYRVDYV